MDWRILVVLLPLLAAGGWAVYNIGKLALEQYNKMMKERT